MEMPNKLILLLLFLLLVLLEKVVVNLFVNANIVKVVAEEAGLVAKVLPFLLV